MTDILKAVEDSRAVGQAGWTRDDVRYAISFTIRDRDAEWRAAVERVRERMGKVSLLTTEWGVVVPRNAADVRDDCAAALDALLAAMEGVK